MILIYHFFVISKNETGTDFLDGTQVLELGNLLKGVNRAVLKKITKEGFLDNLHQITRIKGHE